MPGISQSKGQINKNKDPSPYKGYLLLKGDRKASYKPMPSGNKVFWRLTLQGKQNRKLSLRGKCMSNFMYRGREHPLVAYHCYNKGIINTVM